jgi:hypothetical protein
MASLYITEYTRFGRDDRGGMIPAGQEPAIAAGKLTISSSPADHTFQEACRVVELHTDAICHVKFSLVKDATSATVSHKRLPAGATQFFSVSPGHTVSVVEGV